MKLAFYHRLALTLVAVFMVVAFVLVFAINKLQWVTQSEAEQRLHLGLAGHLVEDNPLLKEGVHDYAALENLFHTQMILGPNFEFYYLDPQGKILTYSAQPGKVKRTSIDLEPIKQLIGGEHALPICGQDPRNADKEKLFSAAPVYNDGHLQGYLYVIIGSEIQDSIVASLQSNQRLRQFALFAVSALVLLLIALLVIFRLLTRPLRRLTDNIETIRQAGFEQGCGERRLVQWQSDGHHEIHRLGSAFNELLTHLDDQYKQLQALDGQRRVLLADLSHDLRTPLANLQGYIETLSLQGETLSADDRQRFVDISLKNARNLKRLIDQIFELAYLESGQVTLHKEAFPLGELLHDVAAKFALTAKAKNIELEVVSSRFDYQVFADIAKLERVLTNLIENAIRHTPEGGKIEIATSPLDNKLRVDIRDSGVGISASEVAFIFDARYQASNSHKDKNLHAGLGLAISKKLMALLDSDLRVSSELGKGTCFSFELALVS